MRKIIKYSVIIVFLFLVVPDVYAQSCSWRSYIDLPSANISDGFFINFNGGYALASEAENRIDVNGSIEYGIAGFVAGLKVYTEKTFCLDLAYQVIEQAGAFPSLSLGLENITNKSYVSPLGETGLIDELYYTRSPEIASAYVVATREFFRNFEMTFGIGRGRFVGYGPRSKYLNLDAFSDVKHEDFMVGVFGGMKISTPVGASFILETDGRDANVGFRYEAGILKGTLSMDKIEHLFAESDPLINAPWVNLSLSFSPVGGSERFLVRPGKLKLWLKDKDSGKYIPGKVIVAKGNVERSFDILQTQKAIIPLEPGVYKITVFSAGYKMKTANIPIKAGSDLDFEISLSKVINPVVKQSMDLTKVAADYYKRGLLKEAKEKLNEAIALYPKNQKAQNGLQLVNKALADDISELKKKARAREGTGDLRGAIALWEQVLVLENTTATRTHIQNLRDRLAAKSRKPVTTTRKTTPKKAPAKKKPSLSKQQIADLYTKGLSAYFDGNYKEAIRYFEQVLKADPTHSQAKRYLGEAKKH
jgi:tetratricopeptide (TPR) repeat protein